MNILKSFTPPGASSMVTRNVFLSAAKNLEKKDGTTDREQLLQKSIVRGPHFFEGTANKVILHCIVSQLIAKS